jgi:hypothetical protein
MIEVLSRISQVTPNGNLCHPLSGSDPVMVACAGVSSVFAVLQWVVYFRAYVQVFVEKRLNELNADAAKEKGTSAKEKGTS